MVREADPPPLLSIIHHLVQPVKGEKPPVCVTMIYKYIESLKVNISPYPPVWWGGGTHTHQEVIMSSVMAQVARARETRFFRVLSVLRGKTLLADDAARILSRARLPIRIAFSGNAEQVVVVGRRQSAPLTDVLEVGGEELLREAASAGGAAVTCYQ